MILLITDNRLRKSIRTRIWVRGTSPTGYKYLYNARVTVWRYSVSMRGVSFKIGCGVSGEYLTTITAVAICCTGHFLCGHARDDSTASMPIYTYVLRLPNARKFGDE